MITRHGTLTRSGRFPRLRRGAQMLEFALLLPLFLFLLLFAIDMGRIILVNGALGDATFQAARAGAQVGGAGSTSSGVSARAFADAVDAYPGVSVGGIDSFVVNSGSTCSNAGSNRYVSIDTTYEVDLITPGLGLLLNIAGGEGEVQDAWVLGNTAVTRCEVVR